MKTTLTCAALAALSLLAGCSVAARSPDMYRDDTQKVLVTKNDAIRLCYDDVLKATPGVGGRVAITFSVETEHGNIVNVAVDKANTTAPAPVADCVTKNLTGLGLTPPDARQGDGSWVYEFTAPPPAQPAAAPSVAPANKS